MSAVTSKVLERSGAGRDQDDGCYGRGRETGRAFSSCFLLRGRSVHGARIDLGHTAIHEWSASFYSPVATKSRPAGPAMVLVWTGSGGRPMKNRIGLAVAACLIAELRWRRCPARTPASATSSSSWTGSRSTASSGTGSTSRASPSAGTDSRRLDLAYSPDQRLLRDRHPEGVEPPPGLVEQRHRHRRTPSPRPSRSRRATTRTPCSRKWELTGVAPSTFSSAAAGTSTRWTPRWSSSSTS